MNGSNSLPHGLRHVLIYVNIGGAFPPPTNSAGDVALLRAANLAMRRKAKGVTDTCLFLIAGAKRSTANDVAVSAFGFPAAAIVHIEDVPQDELISDTAVLQEKVGNWIADWLAKHHPGAIAYLQSGYDGECFWWIGVEQDDNAAEWPIEGSEFDSELPDTHKGKAKTWLTILANALDIEAMQDSPWPDIGQQRAAVAAATLCEWLHGFEAASGNGYNHFDPDSAINSLGISHLYLGFEGSRLSGKDLDEFCAEHDVDIDGLGAASLIVMTKERRSELRDALSRFFGSDACLFWVLHSTIWPQFNRPMGEALNSLVNLEGDEDFADLEAPWSFAVDGWHESADA